MSKISNQIIKIKHCDALSFMDTLLDKSIDLIVTSPPYNLGKSYEIKKPLLEYVEDQCNVINRCASILKDNGSICWQVGNYLLKGSIIPIDILLYDIFIKAGFKLKNRIIWNFDHGLHCSKRLSGRYEVILWFIKSDTYTFNLDSIRIPSKYPNKKYHKGPKKGQLSCNPKGKNPSDVWKIPNIAFNNGEKTEHPCQFPLALVERIILMLTNENDAVLDPYIGSGTTAVAALKNNRNIYGCDYIKDYIDITYERIKSCQRAQKV